MSQDEKSAFEVILRRRAQDDEPTQVLSIEKEENIISKGENFFSIIESWKVRVLLGSGRQKLLSYIVKKEHEMEIMLMMSREMGVFVREITIYRDILPKMEQLLDGIGEAYEIPWGRYVDLKLYSRLILEDLRAQGYRMMDRKKQLGLHSAQLLLKQLGKFHALSRILLDRGEIPTPVFGKHASYYNHQMFDMMLNVNLQKLLALMEKWGDEWIDASNRLKNIAPDFVNRYMKALSVEPNEFTVLCHGDCWTNNLLFRHEEDLERPFAVKFIDFQLTFVCSPARDLTYFINSSVRLDVRAQHGDALLDTYYDSLTTYLTKLGYQGNVPSKEDLEESIRKRILLELGESFIFVPMVLSDKTNDPGLDEVIKEEIEANMKGDSSSSGFIPEVGEPAQNVMKFALKRAMSNGLI